MYVEAAVVTGFGILALTVLRRFEDKNDHLVSRQVSLVLGGIEVIDGVMLALKQLTWSSRTSTTTTVSKTTRSASR